MRPHHAADAPSIDPGVARRLERLDKDLFLTWSRRILDTDTGAPIRTTNGDYIVDPFWYLWIKCDDGRVRLVSLYEHFGHREVQRLETDLARTNTPNEMLQLIARGREDVKERKLEAHRDLQTQKIVANEKKIHDMVFEGKRDIRQAKPFSAPGLSSRSTPGEIVMDAKEAGWELPET